MSFRYKSFCLTSTQQFTWPYAHVKQLRRAYFRLEFDKTQIFGHVSRAMTLSRQQVGWE